jgi:isopropylmalate/homocitrate/citramalate synthase
MLIDAGFKKINAVSLVSPRVMPHMADAEELLEMVGPVGGVSVSALVPNLRGLQRAFRLAERALIDEVLLLYATTRSILTANGLEGDLTKARDHVLDLAQKARGAGLRVAVFISGTFGCSIEGYVDPEVPLSMAETFYNSGVVDEVCFSDSTGQASPRAVYEFFAEVKRRFGGRAVTAHFHDSRGAGLANVLSVLQVGLPNLTIDSAFAGLGGDVPFLPEAAGNICTEDLLCMLHGCGIETGVDLTQVLAVSRLAQEFFPKGIHSHVLAVGPVKWIRR